ncbi:MAG: MotA/TolQ/ExbB proton channel family protein [Ignavibacteria bacterium]|nr:MotA/TolQ/ExbB proton channel family protein [Ignavibacteria bacterium]
MNSLTSMYIDGGDFMHPILIVFILGLVFSFERLYTLRKAKINTKTFVDQVKKTIESKGIEEAKLICEKNPGSVSAVLHAGLQRFDEGLDSVEKAIMTYGGIETGFLEKGLVWISLFIALAPMLGFTGTVQGMIEAFEAIKEANQISPAIVAGGIAKALITTLFGLVVAMILQVFYNYFISRIDSLVSDMEESSVQLIDSLYSLKQNTAKK